MIIEKSMLSMLVSAVIKHEADIKLFKQKIDNLGDNVSNTNVPQFVSNIDLYNEKARQAEGWSKERDALVTQMQCSQQFLDSTYNSLTKTIPAGTWFYATSEDGKNFCWVGWMKTADGKSKELYMSGTKPTLPLTQNNRAQLIIDYPGMGIGETPSE